MAALIGTESNVLRYHAMFCSWEDVVGRDKLPYGSMTFLRYTRSERGNWSVKSITVWKLLRCLIHETPDSTNSGDLGASQLLHDIRLHIDAVLQTSISSVNGGFS